MRDFEALAQAMGELDEDTVVKELEGVMEDGGKEAQQAMEACQKGMDIVGKLFEEGEYFVGDLIYAGELMTQAVAILKDALVSGAEGGAAKTKMILCTVKDDLHDIGKNLVVMMLKGAGFEIYDLGVDVEPSVYIDKAEEVGADIICMSALLTTTMPKMQDCIDLLNERGLRDKYIVMVGGAPVNDSFSQQIGADYYTADAASCAEVAKKAVIEKKQG